MKKNNVLAPLRIQEHPLSFLKGHGGDGVLHGMFWASFFICWFICPKLDDTWRRKMSWHHSGVRNVQLASLKDMEETEYFLACYELYFFICCLIFPKLDYTQWRKNVLTPLSSQERPLSFLKGHWNEEVLPGMLWASLFICCFTCPQMNDT